MANIEFGSLISARDAQPYVSIEITDGQGRTAKIQVTPEDALEQAIICVRAAEAALSDAFIISFARDTLQVKEPHAQNGILMAFREWREKREFEGRTVKVKQ